MPTNLLEGAEELLVESMRVLSDAKINEYIVIGGWCPYLRNQHATSGLSHEGTLDVDILFKEGSQEGGLEPAITALRKAGFISSAKQPFQLLLEKSINGERLIYNVDLLHPSMTADDKRMFVDHLDLDIPMNYDGKRVKTVRSIVLRNSAVLFDKHLFSKFEFREIAFNLVDFTGMFLTKMDSCQKEKRGRDPFDLYVALKNGQINFSTIKHLRLENARIDESVGKLLSYLQTDAAAFDRSVSDFCQATPSPAASLEEALRTTV